MVDHKGSKCLVCGELLKDDDDIVVCPDCGTPYHRACYMKEGKCINTALHESGESWQPDAVRQAPAKRICARCHTENPDGALYCCRCGMPFNTIILNKPKDNGLSENIQPAPLHNDRPDGRNAGQPEMPYMINYSDPLCGMNPSEKYDDDVTLAELGAFVDSNTFYYLPRFKIMKETGSKVSLNLTAMLFPEFYFANRRMIFPAIACMLIHLATTIPSIIYAFGASEITTGIIGMVAGMFNIRSQEFNQLLNFSAALDLILRITMSFFANNIYYKHCLKMIPKIKKSVPPNVTLSALHANGGISLPALLTFVGLEVAAAVVYYFVIYSSMFLK